ncbi:MAG: type VI secretion system tip protein VgrG, partial [Bacteroidota bacterium]
VFSEGEKLQVKKPVIGSPVATLKYGRNILELEAEMDARTQWKSVKSTAWDFAGQALAESESSSSPLTEQGNLTGSTLSDVGNLSAFELRHSGKVEPEELKAWADAAMLKSRLAKIRGRVKVEGNADLKPGITIQLEGCGARFNGKAYVTGVRHEVASGSWFSHLQFGLAPEWFFQKPDIGLPPGGGLTPPVHGLQIGVVVKLESDPDGEHRIQVKLPTLDNAAKGIWSRVCTLDAGNDRGSFFLPEIGDEVIVGFLNDDPRDAVVLGMLNSSAKPAPVQAKDDNHIKGWQTRSKMKVMFDDENKVITIETPAKNQVVISEKDKSILLKDQNGNSLELNDKGITIKSVKDIKIEAAQNMDVKAGKDLKQEGSMNAELKAGMQLKANGGAQAEYSSGGVTQLKGAMVKIN